MMKDHSEHVEVYNKAGQISIDAIKSSSIKIFHPKLLRAYNLKISFELFFLQPDREQKP